MTHTTLCWRALRIWWGVVKEEGMVLVMALAVDIQTAGSCYFL
jgi:hypothetical protein